MSYQKQLEKEIREAYVFLRENNQSIPSETLDFILAASLEKCKQLVWTDENQKMLEMVAENLIQDMR